MLEYYQATSIKQQIRGLKLLGIRIPIIGKEDV